MAEVHVRLRPPPSHRTNHPHAAHLPPFLDTPDLDLAVALITIGMLIYYRFSLGPAIQP